GLGGLLLWLARDQIVAPREMAFILLAVIAMTINKRALYAVTSPAPHTVQAGVRTMLLSVITLQAVVIYAATGNILLTSVIAIGLLIPAVLLGQLIRIT